MVERFESLIPMFTPLEYWGAAIGASILLATTLWLGPLRGLPGKIWVPMLAWMFSFALVWFGYFAGAAHFWMVALHTLPAGAIWGAVLYKRVMATPYDATTAPRGPREGE